MIRRPAAVFTAVAVLLAGCSGPRVTTVRVDAASAHIAEGDLLRVDIGDVNSSIGDAWFLTGAPDPAVLREKGPHWSGACAGAGCTRQLAWDFTATGKGSTTVTFRYCYRSTVDNCDPGPAGRGPGRPLAVAVTVG